MADNVAITAGVGTTIAADEAVDGTLGTVKFQVVKLADGTLGGTDKLTITTADGALVNLGTNNDVTVTGSLTTVSTVTTCSTVTTLSQFGGNAINLGAGAVGTGTLRITLASDDPGVAKLGTIDADTSALFGCVAGTEVQCDIVGSLPAGTNNIGDVDVLSCALPTGASTAAKQPALGTAGTASSDVITVQGIAAMTPILSTLSGTNNIATVTTVTTLGTITNVVHVDDNSGSLTVDGAVTVTNATAANLKAEVTVAAAQTIAVTNAGTFAVQATCTNAGTFAVQQTPSTSGGLATFRSLDLDETEEEVKGSAGQVYKIRLTNFSTSPRYVKVYDNTAAGTTVGSTTPIDTITIPGAASASLPTVITENYGGNGWTFATGITVAATTALADADTGAPGANEVVVTVLYK